MGGTKIFVFQLKQIIKCGLLVVLGLAFIILLICFLVPKSSQPQDLSASAAIYVPGTYCSRIILHNNPIDVYVTVTDSEITDVSLSDMPECENLFYPLFKPTMATLSKEVIEKQSTAVTSTNENEFTTKVLLSAIGLALEKASFAAASAIR